MKNKTSVWSIIILIATIISLIIVAIEVTLTAIGIPAAMDAAKQEAIAGGLSPADAETAATIAVGVIVAALISASAFDVLKIIGGFLFSLKGRWGVFCIVVSIIAFALGIWTLASNISNKGSVGTIVTASIGLAIDLLLVIACFKHRAEIQA